MGTTTRRPNLLYIAFIAAIGGLLLGYNTSIIAGALIGIREEIPLSIAHQSLVVSSAICGAFAGVLVAGQLADRVGRRFSMLIAAALIIGGGVFLFLATSLLGLLMGRVVIGFGVGLTSLISPLYIAEIAPGKTRGAYVTIFQIAVTIGVLFGYIASFFLTKNNDWRLMFGLTIIPATIQFFCLFTCPNSPRFGRKSSEKPILKVSWKDFFQKPLLFALIAGIGISLLTQFCGINTVIYYAPHIFQLSGFTASQDAITVTLGVGLVNFVATFFALLYLDRWGRKPLLYIGLIGMFFTLITLSVALFVNSETMPILTAVNLMLYVAFFSISLGPVTWVIVSEIFPLCMRGRAMSLAILSGWIGNLIVTSTFLHLIEKISLPGTFLFYGMVILVGIYFVYRFIPETKGKTLEEIEASYGKSRN